MQVKKGMMRWGIIEFFLKSKRAASFEHVKEDDYCNSTVGSEATSSDGVCDAAAAVAARCCRLSRPFRWRAPHPVGRAGQNDPVVVLPAVCRQTCRSRCNWCRGLCAAARLGHSMARGL